MRRVTYIERFGPTDFAVGKGGVGMYGSYIFGRRVQASITDQREADT